MLFARVVKETRVLIWKAEDALKLRRSHRIVGNFVGALPCQPHQNIWMGLPLELLPEETTLLMEQGVLQLTNDEEVDDTCSGTDLHHHQQLQPCTDDIEDDGEDGSVRKKLKMSTGGGSTGESLVQCTNSSEVTPSLWQFPRTPKEKLHYQVFKDLWQKGYYLTSGLKYGGDYLVYPGDPFLVHSHFVALVREWSETLSPHQLIMATRVTTKVKKNVLLCSQNVNGQVEYITVQWTGIT